MGCERFEEEGAERFERGEALDDHYETCPDCLAALASYRAATARLVREVRALEPDGDWEARVWAAVASEAPRRPRWLAWLGAVAAIAAAVVAFVLWPRPPGGGDPLGLELQVARGGAVLRGEAHQPGDELHARARAPQGRALELRLYRDGDLWLRCGEAPPCRRTPDGLEVRAPLPAAGRYHALLLTDETAIPASEGTLDADAERARAAGAEVRLSAPIEVW